jgi:hypothetical protein
MILKRPLEFSNGAVATLFFTCAARGIIFFGEEGYQRMRRYQQARRQGGPKRDSGRDSGRPSGHGSQMRTRHRSNGRPNQRGPQTCPMCGAVVGDLKFHMQSKHDDPASHPRE